MGHEASLGFFLGRLEMDYSKLVLTVMQNEPIRVQTPEGDIWFEFLSRNGAKRQKVRITAPREWPIVRPGVEVER